MNTQTLRRTTAAISFLSIIPHIFCCGIPAIMAIISLGTTVGLGTVLATNPFYHLVDTYHSLLITVAIGSVALSGVLNFIAYRIDCHTAASHCTHEDCRPKKNQSFQVFLLSLGLLTLDLAWFMVESFQLGLHSH